MDTFSIGKYKQKPNNGFKICNGPINADKKNTYELYINNVTASHLLQDGLNKDES